MSSSPLPSLSHVARWDLDKTYLRTEFDTLRDLVKTALERPDQKQTNPGAAMLLREMVRAGISVHILSGSPEQMRRRLEDKLRLDGVSWDSFTLKPNLENILRFRFRAVRDQLGYKLPALLGARARLFEKAGGESGPKETLFGDDAEADAFVYSLYGDWLLGNVPEETLLDVFVEGRAYDDVVAAALGSARMVDRGDIVERICIHLERHTPPGEFAKYGTRVVPFYNYLQAAFVVHEDGRISADAVLRVAIDFVVVHRFDGDSLARSYQDLARRGHLRGTGVEALRAAFEAWKERERFPASAELETMMRQLIPMVETAKQNHRDGAHQVPDYRELVRRHNPRARKKK